MLCIVKSMKDLDFSSLMEVYSQENSRTGAINWPDEPEMRQLALAEEVFYTYLSDSFFRERDARYMIWIENKQYISALRVETYMDGMLIEALETIPCMRNCGYATVLIKNVLDELTACGCQRVYSHIKIGNISSLKVHQKCGFRQVVDYARFIDGSINRQYITMAVELPHQV